MEIQQLVQASHDIWVKLLDENGIKKIITDEDGYIKASDVEAKIFIYLHLGHEKHHCKIRQDGDTRTVFDGTIQRYNEFKTIFNCIK